MNHLARALALALLAAPGLCDAPDDLGSETRLLTPTPIPPQVSVRVFLYDTEGKAGGVRALGSRSVVPEGEYAEYQFKGEQPTRVEFLDWSYNSSKPLGTLFLFRLHSSQLGSLIGFYRVTQSDFGPVIFHIPVKGSEVGLPPIRQEPNQSNVDKLMSLSIWTWIADNKRLPTVTLRVTWIPDVDDRQVSMDAHYLQGNLLEVLKSEHWDFPMGADSYVDVTGLWGDYSLPIEADEAGFSRDGEPVGPMDAIVTFEGYGSDSIYFEGKHKTNFGFVNMLFGDFSSDPSVMTPSEIMGLTTLSVAEHRFILEPAIREDLLGQSRLFTNLLSASDVNHDGIIDAADYLIVRPDVPPTPTPGGTPTPFPTATPFPGFGGGTKSDRYRGARGGRP